MTASPPLDADTLRSYARHLFDPSGWKTSRYGDPTVRVLILADRLQPMNRSLAEIHAAIVSYSARLAHLGNLSAVSVLHSVPTYAPHSLSVSR